MKTPSIMQALGLSAALSFTGTANADVNFAKDAGPTLGKTRDAATNCIAKPNGMCALPSTAKTEATNAFANADKAIEKARQVFGMNPSEFREEQERQQLEAEKRAAELEVKKTKAQLEMCKVDEMTSQMDGTPLANPTMCAEKNGVSLAWLKYEDAVNRGIKAILNAIDATLERIDKKIVKI